MQEALEAAYGALARDSDDLDEVAQRMSPPVLLSVREDYANAKRRVLIVDQETLGWGWSSRFETADPDYPSDWPYSEIRSWADFATQPDGVRHLCHAYRIYEEHRSERGSLFWTAMREIASWEGTGLVWTNLYRVDYEGASMKSAPPEAREYLLQREQFLLAEEISILEPDICIFFTGPNYDEAIRERFVGVQLAPFARGGPNREIARLVHDRLPKHTYRLHHPRALRRQRSWIDIHQVNVVVLEEFKLRFEYERTADGGLVQPTRGRFVGPGEAM